MPIPTKTCPSCQASNILLKAQYCHRCGYAWPGLNQSVNKATVLPAKNHIASQILLVIVLLIGVIFVFYQISIALRDPFPETKRILDESDRLLRQIERDRMLREQRQY